MSANAKLPAITRRNHGRGHSYYVNGTKVPGATTVLGSGFPKHLEKWAAEQSARYAVDHWDELAEMLVSERLKLIEGARFEDRDKAARRGTEVHRLAQRLAHGEDVPVPEELEGHVDAYLRFVEEWQPRELLIEAPVANVEHGYCGTIDAVADLIDGKRWLLDLKTTRSGIFKETGCQLAAYRYADFVLDGDQVQPMLPVDRCGAVWLRADRSYEFREIDAGEETFGIFLCAHRISRFLDRDDVIGAPLRLEEVELF
jgi:hypothetical protein